MSSKRTTSTEYLSSDAGIESLAYRCSDRHTPRLPEGLAEEVMESVRHAMTKRSMSGLKFMKFKFTHGDHHVTVIMEDTDSMEKHKQTQTERSNRV